MGISETIKQIVIDNYFKNTCDVNTSIKEAFTKGFEMGLTKGVFPKDQYEARIKADMMAMLEELKNEIIELPFPQREPEYMQGYSCCQMDILYYVIQQKINKLKEVEE